MENKPWSLFGMLLALGGVGLFVYQVYFWLRFAVWNSYSLLDPLAWSSSMQDWVYNPQEWIGFHKILDFIPLTITLIVLGILFVVSNED